MEKFASGIFMWSGPERRTRRYGFVYPAPQNYAESVSVTPTLDREKLDSLNGHRVRLKCVVCEARPSGHVGDLFLGIMSETPAIGEEIELGVGTLVLKADEYAGLGISFGLHPSDGREELWFDPRALFRLHDQTVDFFIEETADPESPAPDLRFAKDRGAISLGDGTLQVSGISDSESGFRLRPTIENLGDGLFIATLPNAHGNPGEFIKISPPEDAPDDRQDI